MLEGEPEAEAIASRLEAVFRSDTAVPVEEVPWAFRRYCETLAARGPVVLALDDLHWAEPPLLDLVEYLAGSARDAPILLVCIAREELAEERPAIPGLGARLTLEPLSDDETNALADQLLPESALDADTHDRLVAAAEGNPLFLEQLVAHVAETGLLEPPETLRALLTARLDRLGPGERGVLERAAVVGRDFSVVDVTELLDAAAAPTAAAHLDVLARRGFIRHVGGTRVPLPPLADPRRRVPRSAEGAPSRAARAIRRRARATRRGRRARRLPPRARVSPQHRARAGLNRHAQRLAEDAGRRLGAAGIRAWKRGEVLGASRLLSRAVALLPAEDEERRELLCELGVALDTAGENRTCGRDAPGGDDDRGACRRPPDRAARTRSSWPDATCSTTAGRLGAAAVRPRADSALPMFEVSTTTARSEDVDADRLGTRRDALPARAVGGVGRARAGALPATPGGRSRRASATSRRRSTSARTPARSGVERCTSLLDNEVERPQPAKRTSSSHLAGLARRCYDDSKTKRSLLVRPRARDLHRAGTGADDRIERVVPIAAAIERLAGDIETAGSAFFARAATRLEAMQNWNPLAHRGRPARRRPSPARRSRRRRETWITTARGSAARRATSSAQISIRERRARKRLRAMGLTADALSNSHGRAVETRRHDRRDRTGVRGVRLDLADVLDAAWRKQRGRRTARQRRSVLYEEKENVVAADAVRRANATSPSVRVAVDARSPLGSPCRPEPRAA